MFRKPKKVKLPTVIVKQVGIEDQAAQEIDVQIVGCTISKVLVDGGSSVNLMTLTTMAKLGLTNMEKTSKVLKMADQSVVTPAGILTNLNTIIGGTAFALDYYIIDPATPSTYPIVLGRPWLSTAKVHVNWNEKKISFGRPRVHLSWATIKYEGETESTDEGYTSDKSSNFMEGNMLPVRY
jgi:hypothetical protein